MTEGKKHNIPSSAVGSPSSGSPSDGSEYVELWIDLFLVKKGHEYFCDIDPDYITDRFNLMNLQKTVSKFSMVIQYIVDELDENAIANMSQSKLEQLEIDSKKTYGMIHARYIITTKGLQKMAGKYKNSDFGRCPRVYCNGQPLLPIGLSDIPGVESVKLYCPACEDIYLPKSTRHNSIDGAYFGTSFAGMFLQTFPELVPRHPVKKYIPKVFGFQLHKQAQLARWQELQRSKLQGRLTDSNINLNKNGGYKS
ncbi:hypothetical protein Kpol_526p41 [Vanderwaltozyma polyspora DSM 70294]|uniref:Casein kinase II subunit beta n=1 Tax=Vanderwaltozyma polyspora (strain ATCC 22028 / DSM 70294 / BCRC 21397 / CBS 2163 / NBRC 10782 / NRRL Y-8283 / UCD 57-17) TaxID=436907 RepID=A7TLU6_VANPO|nr:uncharacterized protein Kpol_526p41 [Vanderwaltozyma polyspora DSM 70294]EDO16788.1 hypothetical protein Kpol_526p41 [Vanderwaltozyma polyspora DSM 70294]